MMSTRYFWQRAMIKETVEQMKKFDEMLREEHPGVYQACSRKSVWMLRKTGFKIFPMAAWVYSRLRGN